MAESKAFTKKTKVVHGRKHYTSLEADFSWLNPFTTIGTIRPKNFFEVTIGIKTDLNLTALYPSGITRHYIFRFRRYKK